MAKLKTDFMNKVQRGIVMVMLPVVAAASISAFASPLLSGNSEAAQQPTPAAAAKTPKETKDMKFEMIKFERSKNQKILLEKYPFLQEIVGEVNASNTTGILAAEAQIWTGSVYDARTNTSVLVVSLDGSDFCGNLGCQTKIFANNQGKGYTLAQEGMMQSSIYSAITKDGINLVNCGPDGAVQSILQQTGFVPVTPVAPAAKAVCVTPPVQ